MRPVTAAAATIALLDAGGIRAVPFKGPLLALSANSPFLDGRHSGLHSARSQIFTKSFPRCGIPEAFGGWTGYADYIDFLVRTNSIVEFTQLWWSVRPHHDFGTVEVRICDAQTTGPEADGLIRRQQEIGAGDGDALRHHLPHARTHAPCRAHRVAPRRIDRCGFVAYRLPRRC